MGEENTCTSSLTKASPQWRRSTGFKIPKAPKALKPRTSVIEVLGNTASVLMDPPMLQLPCLLDEGPERSRDIRTAY